MMQHSCNRREFQVKFGAVYSFCPFWSAINALNIKISTDFPRNMYPFSLILLSDVTVNMWRTAEIKPPPPHLPLESKISGSVFGAHCCSISASTFATHLWTSSSHHSVFVRLSSIDQLSSTIPLQDCG